MPYKDCECCERSLPISRVPFTHSGRDGRPDVDYCQDCYDTGCDLVSACEYLRLKPASAEEIKRRLEAASHDAAVLKGEPTDLCERCGYYTDTDIGGRFVTHDIGPFQRALCPGSGTRPPAEVTAQEIADLYRSFGMEPPAEFQGYRYPWCQPGQPHDPQGCDCGEGG